MFPFEVRQRGRILFTVFARSIRHARSIVEARITDTVAIVIVRCRS